MKERNPKLTDEDIAILFYLQLNAGRNDRSRSFVRLSSAIAEHHKRTCDGETCNISLGSLREMAEAAGAVFTQEEKRMFF